MSPSRDDAHALPPSVEEAYRRKCIQLRSRMREVEEANDQYRLRRERLVRGIRKMRLERAILLETLAKRMNKKGPVVLENMANMPGGGAFEDPETDDSTESPPTPQERPMRIKRPHRRAEDFEGETPERGGGMLPGEGVLGEFVGEREDDDVERRGLDAEGDERDSRMEDAPGPSAGHHGSGVATPAQGMHRYAPPSQEGDADADESMMQD